jgi:para-aminobenzoate synthetase / 4-amino-4-deoxychorismate lyase
LPSSSRQDIRAVRSSPHADPTRGLFETLLVLDGQAVEVDAHVDRITTSLAALFGAELPAGARSLIATRARALRHGRLRLTAVPTEVGPVEIAVSAAEVDEAEVFPPAERGIALRSFVAEGGLGAHKWADRRLLESFAANADDAEVPLLVDVGEEVLEAARGSVFLADGNSLTTPPADGRILPGIARRRALEAARAAGLEVKEERLRLDDLWAGEVFLAGSVRGIEPVRRLDGRELPQLGSVSEQVAAALRRRWLRVPQEGFAAVVAGGRRADRPAR